MCFLLTDQQRKSTSAYDKLSDRQTDRQMVVTNTKLQIVITSSWIIQQQQLKTHHHQQ